MSSPSTSEPVVLRLFEGHGVELEYMIVDRETLAVKCVADELLKLVGGGYEMEVEQGPIAWSNELALHVIEIKSNGPRASLQGLDTDFQGNVQRINQLLEPLGACLMPTAMHPLMAPDSELRLWPHGDDVIYRTFDRIFDCRGHGWANLQSTHINLPFAGDDEFGRLHAAMRMVLPLLPALAASSPLAEGKSNPFLDRRLDFYRNNARRVPSVAGHVVPEPVFTKAAYQELLQGIYRDLAALDPEGILSHEWVNSRGCIARFDRNAIEIRILDIQECPRADVAIVAAVVDVVRAMVEECWSSTAEQMRWDERELAAILDGAMRDAEESIVTNRDFLDAFGFPAGKSGRLGDVWKHLIDSRMQVSPGLATWREPLELIIEEGCLARRITRALGPDPTEERVLTVYRRLTECLARGELFRNSDAT